MICALTSISGAPGVTTTALGLAAVWPRHVLVIDADFHRSALTGSFGGDVPAEPGLLQVAMAAGRPGADLVDMIWNVARPLPGDSESTRRLLVPGVLMPWALTTVSARWISIAPALRQLSHHTGTDVIIDLGRLQPPVSAQPSAIPAPLLEVADLICPLVEPTLYGLVGADAMMQGIRAQAESAGHRDRIRLIRRHPRVRDRDQSRVASYSNHDITRLWGLPVFSDIPTDAKAAAVVTHNLPRDARWRRTALLRSFEQLAATMTSSLDHQESA